MPEPQVRAVKLKIPEAKIAGKNEGFIQKGGQVTEDQVRDLDSAQDIDADNSGLESQESLEQDSSRSLDDYEQKKDHSLDAIKY